MLNRERIHHLVAPRPVPMVSGWWYKIDKYQDINLIKITYFKPNINTRIPRTSSISTIFDENFDALNQNHTSENTLI